MVDIGYGSVQIEDLHLHGLKYPETRLDKIVKGVPTDSFMEIEDIATGESRKTPVKNFIVESMVRYIEQHRVRIPSDENMLDKTSADSKKKKTVSDYSLFDQLGEFVISKYTANGRPVYECKAKDHDVDALMFTLYGYLTQVIKTQNLYDKVPRTIPKAISYDRYVRLRNSTRKDRDSKDVIEMQDILRDAQASKSRIRQQKYDRMKSAYRNTSLGGRMLNLQSSRDKVGRSGISRRLR